MDNFENACDVHCDACNTCDPCITFDGCENVCDSCDGCDVSDSKAEYFYKGALPSEGFVRKTEDSRCCYPCDTCDPRDVPDPEIEHSDTKDSNQHLMLETNSIVRIGDFLAGVTNIDAPHKAQHPNGDDWGEIVVELDFDLDDIDMEKLREYAKHDEKMRGYAEDIIEYVTAKGPRMLPVCSPEDAEKVCENIIEYINKHTKEMLPEESLDYEREDFGPMLPSPMKVECVDKENAESPLDMDTPLVLPEEPLEFEDDYDADCCQSYDAWSPIRYPKDEENTDNPSNK